MTLARASSLTEFHHEADLLTAAANFLTPDNPLSHFRDGWSAAVGIGVGPGSNSGVRSGSFSTDSTWLCDVRLSPPNGLGDRCYL